MQKTRQNAVIHIPLLVFIQWTSIAVIGLNAVALGSISGDQGLLDMKSGSQDYLLLVLGGLSLLSSSFLICLYLHTYFHLINNERSAPSRTILTAELAAGILLVALWASGTWVIMSSYHSKSYFTNLITEFGLLSRFLLYQLRLPAISLSPNMLTLSNKLAICLDGLSF